jgi:hypothetical protein
MSMFLPEGFEGQQQPEDGSTSITPASPETSADDIALMQRVFSAAARNPGLVPSDFMAYFLDWLTTENLNIPIGQVFGYQNSVSSIVAQALAGQFIFHVANFEGEEPVTSTTYSAYTSAPELTGLDNGIWFVLWGASAKGDDAAGGSGLQLSVQPNGSGSLNFAESQEQNYYTSIARGDKVTLSAGAGSNTLQMIALTTIGGHTSKVRYSWIAAVKYSN